MNRVISWLIGIFGLNCVVLLHELGHFIACKLFSVDVSTFSIGFGPTLFSQRIGATVFQIALFPIGGYVNILPTQLARQPYVIKLIILSAGIIVNFLFAYVVFLFFKARHIDIRAMLAQVTVHFRNGIIGPIGIISIISYSATLGSSYFILMLASLSIGIGIFNLFPIPFFDGGQIAWYTIEAVFGKIPENIAATFSIMFFIILLFFIIFISVRDVYSYKR